MSEEPYAAIDCGSHSTRLLIMHGDATLVRQVELTLFRYFLSVLKFGSLHMSRFPKEFQYLLVSPWCPLPVLV